jgi:hypothetical protein
VAPRLVGPPPRRVALVAMRDAFFRHFSLIPTGFCPS